jgi:hypothetical protein
MSTRAIGSDNLYVSIDFEKFKNHQMYEGVATRDIAKGEN